MRCVVGFALAVAIVVAAVVVGPIEAAGSFPVHGLMHHTYNKDAFGSTKAKGSGIAASVASEGGVLPPSNSFVVVDVDAGTTPDTLDSLVSGVTPKGLLLVFPSLADATADDELMHSVAMLEQHLVLSQYAFPVLISFTDAMGSAMGSTMGSNMTSADLEGHDVSVAAAPSTNILRGAATGRGPKAHNVEAWLDGSSAVGARTVLVVAHYDAVGVSPSLAKGSDSNGGGLVGLMATAAAVGDLYGSETTRGPYNVVFLASAGGKLGFAGAKAFLDDADAKLMRAIEVVVCLDALGSGPLSLVTTDVPVVASGVDPAVSAEVVGRLQEALGGASAVPHVEIPQLDPSARTYGFEHERFARAGLTALTLTSRPAPANLLRPAEVPVATAYDVADRAVLLSNVETVVGGLVQFLYPHLPGPAAAALASVDPALVDAWATYVETTPRFAPVLAVDADAGAPVLAAVSNGLAMATGADVQKTRFALRTKMGFHLPNKASAPGVTTPLTLSFYKASSILVDLVALVVSLAFLVAVHAVFGGTAATAALFRTSTWF